MTLSFAKVYFTSMRVDQRPCHDAKRHFQKTPTNACGVGPSSCPNDLGSTPTRWGKSTPIHWGADPNDPNALGSVGVVRPQCIGANTPMPQHVGVHWGRGPQCVGVAGWHLLPEIMPRLTIKRSADQTTRASNHPRMGAKELVLRGVHLRTIWARNTIPRAKSPLTLTTPSTWITNLYSGL